MSSISMPLKRTIKTLHNKMAKVLTRRPKLLSILKLLKDSKKVLNKPINKNIVATITK
ncbi:hypothetical protein PRVXT_002934 [Proteinivorax tanatarense]|uniref:Uncharacterized protein n=1 Tax=Proteinivorax tanatarense TaxID=1260629 RepID=A0AAU7VLM2_9FIRM